MVIAGYLTYCLLWNYSQNEGKIRLSPRLHSGNAFTKWYLAGNKILLNEFESYRFYLEILDFSPIFGRYLAVILLFWKPQMI